MITTQNSLDGAAITIWWNNQRSDVHPRNVGTLIHDIDEEVYESPLNLHEEVILLNRQDIQNKSKGKRNSSPSRSGEPFLHWHDNA